MPAANDQPVQLCSAKNLARVQVAAPRSSMVQMSAAWHSMAGAEPVPWLGVGGHGRRAAACGHNMAPCRCDAISGCGQCSGGCDWRPPVGQQQAGHASGAAVSLRGCQTLLLKRWPSLCSDWMRPSQAGTGEVYRTNQAHQASAHSKNEVEGLVGSTWSVSLSLATVTAHKKQ